MIKKIPNPQTVWADVARKSDVKKGEAISGFAYGNEIGIVRTASGKVYGLGGKFPPADSPVAGSKVVGDTVVDGITGTAFNVATGKVDGPWCPGGVLGWLLGRLTKPRDIVSVQVREQGDNI